MKKISIILGIFIHGCIIQHACIADNVMDLALSIKSSVVINNTKNYCNSIERLTKEELNRNVVSSQLQYFSGSNLLTLVLKKIRNSRGFENLYYIANCLIKAGAQVTKTDDKGKSALSIITNNANTYHTDLKNLIYKTAETEKSTGSPLSAPQQALSSLKTKLSSLSEELENLQ